MIRAALVAVLALAVPPGTASAAPCALSRLAIGAGDASSLAKARVSYTDAEMTTVSRHGARCTVPVDYITGLHRLGTGERLLVAQSSGSSTILRVFDGLACDWTGTPVEAAQGYRVAATRVTVQPVCEPLTADGARRLCRAALVLETLADCRGMRTNEALSAALTRRVLGVGFAGQAEIARAPGGKARLIAVRSAERDPG